MNILIVEDALDQRLILTTFLKELNHKIYEASDGLEALSIIKEDTNNIHILISDWMMPHMDGVELIESIRNTNFNHYIYCILLTGKTQSDSLVQGMNKGADDFISKPVEFDKLEARLNAGIRIVNLEIKLAHQNQKLSNALSVIDKDLQAAAKMQSNLLCEPKNIQGVQFDWYFKPSKILGGDMFGYFSLDHEHIGFYQLDVSGHGIPSALFSFSLNRILSETDAPGSITKEIINNESFSRIREPNEILHLLNQRFQVSADMMQYFTIIYGILNTNNGKLTLSKGGHPDGFWLQSNNQDIKKMKIDGLPIGFDANTKYQNLKIQLDKADRLFFYSDGVTECHNKYQIPFGEEKLTQCLKKNFNQPLVTVVNDIKNQVKNWRSEPIFEDDISFLILEWNP